jgi:hypothetical protein
MANPEHVEVVKQGAEAIRKWRVENPDVRLELREVDLVNADLIRVDLSEADLSSANLSGADLSGADFCGAHFIGAEVIAANLSGASLYRANLSGANLSGANLLSVNLNEANLSRADLTDANLRASSALDTDLTGAILKGCRVYGMSVWGATLTNATQRDLIITKEDEPTITVDSLEVAQFLYVLLRNEKIRDVLDVITRKVVLILGRFTPKRKPILNAIRERLREHHYVPVMFDFDKPASRSFVETVSTLAHLARFIIADFTDPKIVLQEVEHLATSLAVPIVPILLQGEAEPVSLLDARRGRTYVLGTCYYKGIDDLLASLRSQVIQPAEEAAKRPAS